MTHLEMQELIPLYAVDALPDEEDMELRMHVEACQECALMLREHLETAVALAISAKPIAPSPELKQKVLRQLETPVAAGSAPVVRAPLLRRWFTAAALAAFVAVAGVSAVLARRVDSQTAEIQEQRRLLALAGSPNVQSMQLSSSDGSPGAAGRVFVDPGREVSGVVLTGLSDPGQRVYALWLIESNKPQLVENFSPDDSGTAITFLGTEVGAERTVAVTLESRPNTPAPEGPTVLKL